MHRTRALSHVGEWNGRNDDGWRRARGIGDCQRGCGGCANESNPRRRRRRGERGRGIDALRRRKERRRRRLERRRGDRSSFRTSASRGVGWWTSRRSGRRSGTDAGWCALQTFLLPVAATFSAAVVRRGERRRWGGEIPVVRRRGVFAGTLGGLYPTGGNGCRVRHGDTVVGGRRRCGRGDGTGDVRAAAESVGGCTGGGARGCRRRRDARYRHRK